MSHDFDSDDCFWQLVEQLVSPTPAATLAHATSSDLADYAQAEADGAAHMWSAALSW